MQNKTTYTGERSQKPFSQIQIKHPLLPLVNPSKTLISFLLSSPYPQLLWPLMFHPEHALFSYWNLVISHIWNEPTSCICCAKGTKYVQRTYVNGKNLKEHTTKTPEQSHVTPGDLRYIFIHCGGERAGQYQIFDTGQQINTKPLAWSIFINNRPTLDPLREQKSWIKFRL